MSDDAQNSEAALPGWGEVGRFTVALVLFLTVQLWATGGLYLIQRYFWLDELYTWTLVRDPHLGHMMEALADGVDTNPPAIYLLYRLALPLAPGSDEVGLRLLNLGFLIVGMAGLYALLRQTAKPLTAATAMLALWCVPTFQRQAFEARFYVPWLSGVVVLCLLLTRCRRRVPGIGLTFSLAAVSVFVCTVHYFGVITWGLVVTAEFAAHRLRGRTLAALACGPLALLACLPMLARQRAAFELPTWITLRGAEVLPALGGMILAAAAVVLALRRRRQRVQAVVDESAEAAKLRRLLRIHAGLASVGLLPLLLIVMSLTVQPMAEGRYALPAVVAAAPLLTLILAQLSAWRLAAVGVVVLGLSSVELAMEAAAKRHDDDVTDRGIARLRALDPETPVLFELVLPLKPICHYAPDLASRCRFLDFEIGQIGPVHPARVCARDAGRAYARHYGTPALMPWKQVQALQRAYLVFSLDPDFPGEFPPNCYPGFDVTQVQPTIYLLSRKSE